MQGPRAAVKDKVAYVKIKAACEVAVKDAFDYIWIDTCCIDKSSSAELSEAINSMFRFYEEADVCYVYLSDVEAGPSAPSQYLDLQFAESKWFTRGWTLQELIAPRSVIFYNNSWEELGTKSSLEEKISDVTGIQREVLSDGRRLGTFSIAQRMSWAAHRETTRLEDRAYSLMGVFNVKMPMLYGEGEYAFVRLQEEILKRSDDHTIFAWIAPEVSMEYHLLGMLASSPSFFQSSGNIVQIDNPDANPFALTNKGVSLELLVVHFAGREHIVLDCREEGVVDRCLCVEMNGTYRVGYQLFAMKLEERGTQYRRMLLKAYVTEQDLDAALSQKWKLSVIDEECLTANGLSVVETFPDDLISSGTLRTNHLYKEKVGGLKVLVNGKKKHFLLIFGPRGMVFSACGANDNIQAAVQPLAVSKNTFQWDVLPDYSKWHYPNEDFGITANIRRQVISGERSVRVYVRVASLKKALKESISVQQRNNDEHHVDNETISFLVGGGKLTRWNRAKLMQGLLSGLSEL